ncbi:MAG: ribbon-helix-helix protein, CopG family [Clostridia bacterium]|nr:ribbon-helix-helix protein, CopG family [Clostridia bacterium]
MNAVNDSKPLIIKKRGEDGNRMISVRIREDVLAKVDNLAAETNHSRNELINMLLEYGAENAKVE